MPDLNRQDKRRQRVFKDYPPNSITPRNASFVESNFDKIQDLGKKIVPDDSKWPKGADRIGGESLAAPPDR